MTDGMHGYSLPAGYRVRLGFWLAFPGIASAWALFLGLDALDRSVPWWLDAPSVLGFYGVVFWIMNRWVWKTRVLRWVGVAPPNLNGVWTGELKSSFDEYQAVYAVTMYVVQTWSQMSVVFMTVTSDSRSNGAALEKRPEGTWILTHQFLNEPKAQSSVDMQIHRGTSSLVFDGDNTLTGEYYTGRGRGTHGTVSLTRS